MFEDCEMKLAVLATEQSNSLKYEVVASEQLCIDREAGLNPWDYTARLQITNIGLTEVNLTYPDGAIARNAFANTRISEQFDQEEPIVSDVSRVGPPIDRSKVKNTDVALGAGQTITIGGDPVYVLSPLQLSADGKGLNGSSVPRAHRWERQFLLYFKTGLALKTSQGTQALTPSFTIPLKVFVKPDDTE